jgi:asparagine synthase (glutamine-hydrolysing)
MWASKTVALGHALLKTTPESAHELQPVVHESGRYVLVADARIDNRKELASHFSFDRPLRRVPDSAFILAAFEKWGRNCYAHLIGAFAFAIWDRQERTLFCARDVGGIRPLYYVDHPGLFLFASSMEPLVHHSDVNVTVNDERVSQFIIDMDVYKTDREATCYNEIRRLPARRVLMVSADDVQTRTGWEPDLGKELHRATEEEYALAFREVFRKAVKARMRSTTPLGSMLSGGLDSSSITCMADTMNRSEHPIHTISAVYPSFDGDALKAIDERSYINAVLERGRFRAHRIRGDQAHPFIDLEQAVAALHHPFSNPNNFIIWNGLKLCNQQGIRVLFHGSDGDTVISHGTAYIARLIERGEWNTFVQATGANQPRSEQPVEPWQVFNVLGGMDFFLELLRERKFQKSLRGVRGAKEALGLSFPELVLGPGASWPGLGRHVMQSGRLTHSRSQPSIKIESLKRIIQPQFHHLIDTRSTKGPRGATTTAREEHWADIDRGTWQHGFEMYDAFAAHHEVELRYPFFDRRVIEIALAMPGAMKVNGGWGRYVLRRAMEDILPPEVQWRVGKANLAPGFARGMEAAGPHIRHMIEEATGPLSRYVKPEALQMLYMRANRHSSRPNLERLLTHRLVVLDTWLRARVK